MSPGARAKPIIVASGNGAKALPSGIRILKRGGSALDAVEACARYVEADVTDVSVGRGGLPNVRRAKKLLPIVRRVIAKRLGTVNFIALDRKGDIASAVTTSGWGYKYPGRVGDSPIVGAGNYCDTIAGGACCTGYGELAMRM